VEQGKGGEQVRMGRVCPMDSRPIAGVSRRRRMDKEEREEWTRERRSAGMGKR